MRKTKTPHRSRLIRKWDGTPVSETTPDDQAIEKLQVTDTPNDAPRSRAKESDTIFEFESETELSDTLE